jgi:hypothetical protein
MKKLLFSIILLFSIAQSCTKSQNTINPIAKYGAMYTYLMGGIRNWRVRESIPGNPYPYNFFVLPNDTDSITTLGNTNIYLSFSVVPIVAILTLTSANSDSLYFTGVYLEDYYSVSYYPSGDSIKICDKNVAQPLPIYYYYYTP